MTPEGRQKLADMTEEMRQWRASNSLRIDDRVDDWAERLALLLAEAHPQVLENKEDTDTRVETMGDSKDNPTAAPDVAEGDRLIPLNQVSNESISNWMRVLMQPLTVVVFREDGTFQGQPYSAYVAQSKEFDYAAQGDSEIGCLHAFERGFVATVLANVASHNTHIGAPCPDDVWADCCAEPGARIEVRRTFGCFDTGGGNQPPSGLRGDPGAPRTVHGEARDTESSLNSPPPVTPTEDQP